MTYVEKRRLLGEELEAACKAHGLTVEQVAEAWVEKDGRCELVLVGFVDKIVVNLKETGA